MFFCDENIPFIILNVIKLEWKRSQHHVLPRSCGALTYRLKGSAEFVFNDGCKICTKPGEVFYCPANVGYNVSYDDGEIIAFHFEGSCFSRQPEVIKSIYSGRMSDLFNKAYNVFNEHRRGYKYELIAVFFEILSLCVVEACPDAPKASVFENAVKYLTENIYSCELSLADICSRFYVSVSGFRKYFNSKYGISPVKYITELRLREAERLLLSTEQTIESIAYQCGYNDVKYFSRVFSKSRGCSPSSFRKFG